MTETSEIPHVPGGSVFVNPHSNLGHCTLCDWQGVPVPGREGDCPACHIGTETDRVHRTFGELPKLKPIRQDSVPRNAPCPCGSGQKYKKCHEGKELPA